MSQRYADAYRSILPPDSLREKVLSATPGQAAQKGKIAVFSKVASLAACFLLLFASLFLAADKPQLAVSEDALSSLPAVAAQPFAMRRSNAAPVCITLQTNHKTTLSLQGGTMCVYAQDGTLLFDTLTDCTVDADCTVLLQPETDAVVLTVNGRGLPVQYTLQTDDDGRYTLLRE